MYLLHSKTGKMDTTCLSLIAGALVLLIFYFAHKYTYWKRRGIPTAKGFIPLLGHVLPILTTKTELGSLVLDFYKDLKDSSMFGFYKLITPVLVVCDPNLVKTVLQSNFSSFHENAFDLLIRDDSLFIKNPFFTWGEEWVTGRKRLTYAFSSMRLKILFVAVSGVCKKFVDFLNRRLKSKDKYEVELKYLFAKFTGEVVANAGVGIEGHCFDDEPSPMAFDKIGSDTFRPSFINAVIQNILYSAPVIGKMLNVGVFPKTMDDYFRQIVKENMEIRRKETTPRSDFFQLMADLEKAEGTTIDVETLASHVANFFADGFETSSVTLCFIGYHLTLHPDVQQRVREEVQSTLAKHGGELTYDALKEMTYMDQVISESQRHFPVLGVMRKKCTQEFELQGPDGLCCRVKPGTEILIPVYGLHSDPKYWTNPEDFDPERFSPDRKQSIEKMTFIPFGEGPRICVGMRMAILQMKACLATLLRNYKMEFSPKMQLPIKLNPHYFLSLPKNGVWVYISKL